MENRPLSQHHYGILVPVAVVVILAGVVTAMTLIRSRNDAAQKDPDIVAAAQQLYQEQKRAGISMDAGPCLGTVAGDWAVDIAHSPRMGMDDEAQNQCALYRAGTVHHFIELSPEGTYLRSQ